MKILVKSGLFLCIYLTLMSCRQVNELAVAVQHNQVVFDLTQKIEENIAIQDIQLISESCLTLGGSVATCTYWKQVLDNQSAKNYAEVSSPLKYGEKIPKMQEVIAPKPLVSGKYTIAITGGAVKNSTLKYAQSIVSTFTLEKTKTEITVHSSDVQ